MSREPPWTILAIFHLALGYVSLCEANAPPSCRMDSSKCYCDNDSLTNILTICCQSDVFHVFINGSQLSGEGVFNQMPCHSLIEFRIHAPRGRTMLAPGGASFNGLPNLEELHITGDRNLFSLPRGAFSKIGANLRLLNLSGNGLSGLEGEEFGGPSDGGSLEDLDISHNQLQKITPGSFSGLSRLRKLNIMGNRITEISAATFTGLEVLEELDIRANPVGLLFGGTFERLTKLRQLLISGSSPITPWGVLSPGMLYGLQSLRHLTLSGLEITQIHADTFMNLRHLNFLDLSNNGLTEIPTAAFSRMGLPPRTNRLRRLNLSQNRIKCLPSGAFSTFRRLEWLDLSGNLLTVVSGQPFRGMLNIRDLNLLDNPIVAVTPDAFDSFTANTDTDQPPELAPMVHRPPEASGALLVAKGILVATIDAICPSVPIAARNEAVPRKQSSFDAAFVDLEGSKDVTEVGGFFPRNRVSIIVIAICVFLTLVVTSATILSCQSCRRRRRKLRQQQRRRQVMEDDGTSSLAQPLSDAGKSLYSASLAPPNHPAAGSLYYNGSLVDRFNNSFISLPPQQPPVISPAHEKISMTERLLNLGQQNLAPPPYPHNLAHTVEERLRQVAAASSTTTQPSTMTQGYASTYHHRHTALLTNYSSGHSSPSNPGSSPRFSYSTGSSRHQNNTLHISPMMIGGDCDILSSRVMGQCPASISPLHESSGFGSDKTSSSLAGAPTAPSIGVL